MPSSDEWGAVGAEFAQRLCVYPGCKEAAHPGYGSSRCAAHCDSGGCEYRREHNIGEAAVRVAPDLVREPPHYKSTNAIRIDLDAKSYLSVPVGKLEARHVIEAFGLGWHAGNAVKYLIRAGRKGALLDDLRKAENMIGILIAFLGDAK